MVFSKAPHDSVFYHKFLHVSEIKIFAQISVKILKEKFALLMPSHHFPEDNFWTNENGFKKVIVKVAYDGKFYSHMAFLPQTNNELLLYRTCIYLPTRLMQSSWPEY